MTDTIDSTDPLAILAAQDSVNLDEVLADVSITAAADAPQKSIETEDPKKTSPEHYYGLRHPRLPSYDDWSCSIDRDSRAAELNFKLHLFPFLKACRTCKAPETYREVAGDFEWVVPLMLGTFREDDLRQSWKVKTGVLLDIINSTFAKIITQLFWKASSGRPWDKQSDYNGMKPADGNETVEPDLKASCEDELAVLNECFYRAHKDRIWETLCGAIQGLCYDIGIPGARFSDLVKSIQAIQTHFAYNESELRRQYYKLHRQYLSQQRIITCLTFRHILENLPGPRNPDISITQHWKTFWSQAWAEAEKRKNSLSSGSDPHPLHKLVDRPNIQKDDIRKFGKLLYGQLSADIHAYACEAVVHDYHWGANGTAILDALIPENAKKEGRIDLGDVNWNGVRHSFLGKAIKEKTPPVELEDGLFEFMD